MSSATASVLFPPTPPPGDTPVLKRSFPIPRHLSPIAKKHSGHADRQIFLKDNAIHLTTPHNGPLTFQLISPTGRIVLSQEKTATVPQETSVLSLPAEGLSPGVYIFRVHGKTHAWSIPLHYTP
ncbi:T9SS type A sorting domain-containing protein [Chitinivibrio alkaliphilus]|uniref:T9SS type A sorting domain-containing protein n=1 Tax=Chitinivibrio alkaliphilus TaxID=1505232 RepID=UPI0012DF69F5